MGLLMIIWAVLATLTAVGGNFDPYMDNLLFSINWPGPGPGAGGAQKPTGTAAVSLVSEETGIWADMPTSTEAQ